MDGDGGGRETRYVRLEREGWMWWLTNRLDKMEVEGRAIKTRAGSSTA